MQAVATSAIKTPPSYSAGGGSKPTSATSPKKVAAPVAVNVPPPEGMVQCTICGRNFNDDRIAKHETICSKTAAKKRKIFDSTKHRVQVSTRALISEVNRKCLNGSE